MGAAKKMKKNMVSTSADVTAAWDQLGVAVTDNNGELRNSTEVFYDVLEALSKIPNETERDILAMQLFGKSADSLAGIVDDGGAALQEFGKEAENAGLILSQDALDGANAFNDGLDTIKAKAAASAISAGASLAENLLPVLDYLVGKMGGVMEWISKLDGGQLKLLATILLLVAAISPVAGIISRISTTVGALTGLFGTLSGAVALYTGAATTGSAASTALANAMTFISSNPIVLLTTAIIALAALIALKGDEIQAILQKVDDFLQGIFLKDWRDVFGPGLGDALNAFFATTKNMWDSVKLILDGIIDFIRGVFTGDWQRAWTGVKEIFSGVFNSLVAIAKAPINGVIGCLNGAISGINGMIRALNNIHFEIPDWVPGLGGKSFGFNLPKIANIPLLAKGGILEAGSAIVGEKGPELLSLMNGKARVTPLTSSDGDSNAGKESGAAAGYNQTLNFYTAAMTPSEVARQTRNATRNMLAKAR